MATERQEQMTTMKLSEAGSILREIEGHLGNLAPAIGAVNGASRTFRYIAESCSHQDDGGGYTPDAHLHEPGDGGQKWCGPCVAFRALHGIAVGCRRATS